MHLACLYVIFNHSTFFQRLLLAIMSCQKCENFSIDHQCLEHSPCISKGSRALSATRRFISYNVQACNKCTTWLAEAKSGNKVSQMNLNIMVRKIREHRAKSRCPREDIMNFFPDSQASAEVLSAAKFVERENTTRSNSGSKSSFLMM